MADQEKNENQQDTEQGKTSRQKLLHWLIPALAVILCASAGFVVGRLFGTRGTAQTVSAAEAAGVELEPEVPAKGDGKSWFYDLDSVVANLNEPGVSRYVRVGLTLEMDSSMEEKEGIVFLDKKKPLLKHWLTLYLSSQTIEDIRGKERLQHMQTQISDAFNQSLFPNATPHIKRVLFKELSIQ
jgi:flagellar basal body-associated protein FliL